MNYVLKKFPFRINAIQTNNKYEFQSTFHWQIQDLGMNHKFIRVGTPQLKVKVEIITLEKKLQL